MSLPFDATDWAVIAAYIAILVAGGWYFTPRHTDTAKDYFLAGGTVPAWLAAVSVPYGNVPRGPMCRSVSCTSTVPVVRSGAATASVVGCVTAPSLQDRGGNGVTRW